MKIVVCVKYVPDVQSDRRFTEAGTVERVDDSVLNELDENPLEEAISLVEAHGGEVIALTVGPEDAIDAVRKGLQMGADAGVHVCDDAIAGSDAFATARVLAAAIARIDADGPVDLVFAGMASLDGLTSLVPAALAAYLGWAPVTYAATLTVDAEARTVLATRNLDAVTETVQASMPAIVSVTDQINEPRYPSFKGIMAAKKKPVATWTLTDLGVEPESVGVAGSWSSVEEAVATPPRTAGEKITDTGDAGRRLAEYLSANALA